MDSIALFNEIPMWYCILIKHWPQQVINKAGIFNINQVQVYKEGRGGGVTHDPESPKSNSRQSIKSINNYISSVFDIVESAECTYN